ncbi:hypothetical protein [Asticcacaulis sp. AND118]|uniref:hypothetical protein n=1 Tax=Asticcacaulis sp. AND118 TaxID=2840468 RepID=UPI001CFFFEEA|nr:hypothetical protein [Asticcacaulis sp. AND118]UDF04992.1 hypothetical protein LH365_16495 [Asticcacaulis sp. AND118]
MTEDEFIDMAQAFGGNIDRWPEAVQGPARLCLDRVPGLQAYLAAEQGLDDLFSVAGFSHPTAPQTIRMEAALFDALDQVSAKRFAWSCPLRQTLWPAVAYPTAAIAGVLFALALPLGETSRSVANTSILAAAFEIEPMDLGLSLGVLP